MLITWGLVRLIDFPWHFVDQYYVVVPSYLPNFLTMKHGSHSNIYNIRSQWWISFHFKHEIIGTLVTLHYDLPTKQILLKKFNVM